MIKVIENIIGEKNYPAYGSGSPEPDTRKETLPQDPAQVTL